VDGSGGALSRTLRFLRGDRAAIRAVAADRGSMATGAVLVVTAGIAREYDQRLFVEHPLAFFAGLPFSFIAASFIFAFVDKLVFRRAPEAERGSVGGRFATFLGVFWMTAPLAWLYAIPVERFLDEAAAAAANLGLLAIVAFWRVALLSRAVAVLSGAGELRAAASVCLPAAIELGVVGYAGALAIALKYMSGAARIPAGDRLFLDAAGVAILGAIALAIGSLAVLYRQLGESIDVRPLPPRNTASFPAGLLAAICAAWVLLAVLAQRELAERRSVERLARPAAGSPRTP
jgi:hypothetical protein